MWLRASLLELSENFWTSAFGSFKSQKAFVNQNPQAHYNEILSFWLMGSVWLLKSSKACSLKLAKNSFKQGPT
jgi:hypothetical protein